MALIILLLSEANGSCLICCPERMTITTKDRVALHHFCCCRLYPSYGFFQYFGRSLPYSSSTMLLHVSEQQFPVYFLSSLLLQGLYFSLFWKWKVIFPKMSYDYFKTKTVRRVQNTQGYVVYWILIEHLMRWAKKLRATWIRNWGPKRQFMKKRNRRGQNTLLYENIQRLRGLLLSRRK